MRKWVLHVLTKQEHNGDTIFALNNKNENPI